MENSLRGLAVQDGSNCIVSHRTPTGKCPSVKTRENYTCEKHICPASSTGRCPQIPGELELWLIPSPKYAMPFPVHLYQLYEFNLCAAHSKRSKANNRKIAKKLSTEAKRTVPFSQNV